MEQIKRKKEEMLAMKEKMYLDGNYFSFNLLLPHLSETADGRRTSYSVKSLIYIKTRTDIENKAKEVKIKSFNKGKKSLIGTFGSF